MTPVRWRRAVLVALALALASASARETAPAAQATFEALFTPGDVIDAELAGLIDGAEHEVLVNAFSFTNRKIARALAAAQARGARVEIVADRAQTLEPAGSAVRDLARRGVPVWLDGNFAAAHNKVMIIDAATPRATVVTGSYNYTTAAQTRNAENVLIVRHDSALAQQYRANFLRLRDRATRYDGTAPPRR
jgi:phosphatidylserine/phosphatidylglycerophosphate/cardiolipin synthase-like enzyme